MSNPWDRPPLPSFGDANDDFTYAGVGRVLSQWEHVELQLGYLHSALRGKYQDYDTMIDYGVGSAFRDRFRRLEAAARAFFVRYSSQEFEARFEALRTKVLAFADRRHDVAHGIVRDETWTEWRIRGQPDPESQGRRYFLLPTHYKAKNFNLYMHPEYSYTYPTLRQLAHQLMLLSTEVMGFGEQTARFADSKP
jgi:hypothetical protein